MSQQHPLIGTALWVRKDGKLLLSKRAQVKDGADTWCPPGGHLEMFETIEACAVRETREEAGIEVEHVQLMTFIEDPRPDVGIHYITFVYVADWKSGTPRPQEGETQEWSWFTWGELPQPLFRPTQIFVDMHINPLEYKAKSL